MITLISASVLPSASLAFAQLARVSAAGAGIVKGTASAFEWQEPIL